MAQETYYRQCVLTRPTERGITQTVSWLPERAHGLDTEPGVVVRLKKHGSEEYEPGQWTVESVGTQRRPERLVKDLAHNWQRMRAATDV